MPSITVTTTERCPCCSIANTLQCRARGGTAELIGYSEFAGYASTPPKKYRRKDLTHNGWYRCWYTDAGCTTLGGSDTVRRTGYCLYDVTTGTLDSSAALQEILTNAGICADGGSLSSSTASCPAEFTAFTGATVSNTATTNTRTGDGACNSGEKFFGNQVQTLSVEDTESDAITRLLAVASWGSWINSGAVGCTGSPPSCCIAQYESRTSAFTFSYAEAEARVTATGLTPSTSYTANIELYRRAYGSGSYVHYQTATVTGTSDGSGNLTTSAVTVTNTKGYETYAASASLFVT